MYLPDTFEFPEYVYKSSACKLCNSCKRKELCNDSYLKDVEHSFGSFLQLRNVDEIIEMKAALEKISKSLQGDNDICVKTLAKEFEARKDTLQNRIDYYFPKIRRWSNIVTVISIPIALSGLFWNADMLKFIGAGIAGSSHIAREMLAYLDSKYRWVEYIRSRSSTR